MQKSYSKSKLVRRSRVFRGSLGLWRPRLVFWTGALAIGVTSVGFAWMADFAQETFHHATMAGEWTFLLPLLVTPLGFIACAWLAITYFPNSQGSGIPQAIAARHPGESTAIVTLSHDIKIDDPALIAALNAPTGYIAALGSRRSHAARIDRLTAAGFDADALARIDGPAGLDIGAIGPAEIALSITAGMVAGFNARG